VSTLAALVQRGLLEVRTAEESGQTDHVAVVLRRQRLLAPLEGQGFVPVVEAASAGGEVVDAVGESVDAAGPDGQPAGERELVNATVQNGQPMLGGAHVPADVVPPRPEPFLPRRQADFEETAGSSVVRPVHVQAGPSATVGDVVGATATAPDLDSSVIERDPNVNRSLMLRLIAGVRGL
jgi:hypothetical protein